MGRERERPCRLSPALSATDPATDATRRRRRRPFKLWLFQLSISLGPYMLDWWERALYAACGAFLAALVAYKLAASLRRAAAAPGSLPLGAGLAEVPAALQAWAAAASRAWASLRSPTPP